MAERLVAAERHVAGGRQHIAQQEILVSELRHRSNPRLLALAKDLLATMLTIQEIAERHLEEERDRGHDYIDFVRDRGGGP